MLILVELLEIDECVSIARIEAQDLLESFERPIDEAAVPKVQSEAQKYICVFERCEVRPLQQPLMDVDGAADLSLLPVQVAEDHLDFQCVGVEAGGLSQLVDRLVYLVVDQKIEAEHVVGGFAQTAPVDPASVAELVPFPCLAHCEPQKQGAQYGQEVQLGGQNTSVRHRS